MTNTNNIFLNPCTLSYQDIFKIKASKIIFDEIELDITELFIFCIRHQEFFFKIISIRFPFTFEQIVELEDYLDFKLMSENSYLYIWQEELYAKFEMKWKWERLNEIDDLQWKEEIIEEFDNKWEWEINNRKESLAWSSNLIKKYILKWDWEKLSANQSLPWSTDFIYKFAKKWRWKNDNDPWSNEISELFFLEFKWIMRRDDGIFWYLQSYEDFKDELEDDYFGEKLGETMHYDKEYAEQFLQERFSNRTLYPYYLIQLEKFKRKWNWQFLDIEEDECQTIKKNENYQYKWQWDLLSCNETFQWTFEFIEKNKDNLNWDALIKNHGLWNSIFKNNITYDFIKLIAKNLINKELILSDGLFSRNDNQTDQSNDIENIKPIIETESKKIISKPYYLFFDTETTGLPKNWKAPISDVENWPRLIQLAYIVFDENGQFIISEDFIIKPDNFTIPQIAINIHGISNEKAISEGKPLLSILQKFQSLINEVEYVVAHNFEFDSKIIGAEFIRNNLSNPLSRKKNICTKEISTNYCAIDGPYGYKWPTLTELHYELFDTGFKESHDAAKDIQITAKCFWKLKELGVIK